MPELTDQQISRQDYVDNIIFETLQRLNPTRQEIEWNIEMIGEVRDAIEDWLAAKMNLCSEREFYPFVEEE